MRKSILIIVVIFVVVFLGYYYISGLPHYTFYLIYKSVKNHDVESFYKYVDVDNIIDNFINNAWKEVAQKHEAQNEWSALGVGIAQAMKPVAKSMLTQIAKQEITNAIENIEQPTTSDRPSGETPIKGFIERFKSFKNLPKIEIKTSGRVTDVKVAPYNEEQSFVIKMRQVPQRYWKIVAITIPNLSVNLDGNESEAKARVMTVATALETYAAVSNGYYPSDESVLTDAKPPYLNDSYNNKTIQGYNYSLELDSKGYKIIARPSNCGTTGNKIFEVITGGIKYEEKCGDTGSLIPNKRELTVKESTEQKVQNIKNISNTTKYLETDEYKNYYNTIRNKIANVAYNHYNRAEVGEVSLAFIIQNNGEVKDIIIMEERSTNSAYLRKIAIESIKAAAPFPAFPKELEYPQLSFNIALSYEIE